MDMADGLRVSDAEDVAMRRQAVAECLEGLDPHSESWEADVSVAAMVIVEALLYSDAATLQELTEPLRDALSRSFDDDGQSWEVRGYLRGLLAATRLGLERLPDRSEIELAPGSHAQKMLRALAEAGPLNSAELRDRLHTSDSQLSRVGRNLLAHGLVVQRRAGRVAVWELAPRGRQLARRGDERRGHRAR
jgi:hypothetical protein